MENSQKIKDNVNQQLDKIKNKLIIVEGKKDKIALEKLGLTNIIILNKPLYKIVEEVKCKECVILTDLDKKGKQIYGYLNSNLQRFGVRIDNNFRNFLFKKTKLRQIEGIYNYINKIFKQQNLSVYYVESV